RSSFEKLGNTGLQLASFVLHNEANCFVPVSRLNRLRREIAGELEEKLRRLNAARVASLQREVCPAVTESTAASQPFAWSIKVDRVEFLDALEDADVAEVEELVVDIARDHPTALHEALERWASRLGRERIRLALPALTRAWEDRGIRHKIRSLRDAGWMKS